MATFNYTAKEGPHKVVDGIIHAENQANAICKIKAAGYMPIDIVETETLKAEVMVKASAQKFDGMKQFNGKRIKLKEVTTFTQEMSDLIDASVPILTSLQIVSQQMKKGSFKDVVDSMYLAVKDGGSFANALAQHPTVFSVFYVNMVKAGEISSQLEKVLARLAEYLQKEQETRGKMLTSLAYPSFLLVVGIITMFVLLTFVIPRLTVMFDDLDQALPLPTMIITTISAFCAQYWWLILALFAGATFFAQRLVAAPQGKKWIDLMKLQLPLINDLVKIFEVSRFTRTLGTLVESGVPINTAIESVSLTIDNAVLQEKIENVSQQVTQGSSLKAALSQCEFFPDAVINMIAVGEETGRLDRSLYKIADTYERKSEQAIKTILSLLGPVCLVIIVSAVGFVVIALLLPIFQMNLLIQ